MPLGIRVRNLDRVKEFISTLPRNIRGEATKEAGTYLIGNKARGLKHYPRQVPWSKYKRTGAYGKGFVMIGDGVKRQIVNEVPYAGYVRTRWAGMPWNWRTIEKVISDNMAGMFRAINKVLQEWINRNEPK